MLICDREGHFSAEVEVNGPILHEALDHPVAECLLEKSTLGVLVALTLGEPWTDILFDQIYSFLEQVQDAVRAEGFH